MTDFLQEIITGVNAYGKKAFRIELSSTFFEALLRDLETKRICLGSANVVLTCDKLMYFGVVVERSVRTGADISIYSTFSEPA